jgi:hypothetical protein
MVLKKWGVSCVCAANHSAGQPSSKQWRSGGA